MTDTMITDTRLMYEVLPYLADGLTNAEIAPKIHIAASGVKNRLEALMHNLGARNRTHAVAIAYDRGLLTPRGNGQPPSSADAAEQGAAASADLHAPDRCSDG